MFFSLRPSEKNSENKDDWPGLNVGGWIWVALSTDGSHTELAVSWPIAQGSPGSKVIEYLLYIRCIFLKRGLANIVSIFPNIYDESVIVPILLRKKFRLRLLSNMEQIQANWTLKSRLSTTCWCHPTNVRYLSWGKMSSQEWWPFRGL